MIDRNESLRDQIATIVQAGYSQRKTSVETADEIKSKISFLSILTRLERENAELRTDVWRWQNEHLRLLAENAELREALNLAFSIPQMSDQQLGYLIENCRKVINSKP
jgi:cell shape-determining protein MreC